MKKFWNFTIIAFLVFIISGCATWDGVKKDSKDAWEATKDTSSKAYDSTKEAIHNATK